KNHRNPQGEPYAKTRSEEYCRNGQKSNYAGIGKRLIINLMKNFLTLFLLFGHTFIYAQIKYNAKPKVDREVQILLDEGKKCLEIPGKECEHFFLEAITYGKDHKVAYLDYLYFQLGYYFDARSQYDSSLYYTKKAYELTDKNDANSAYPLILNSLGANYYRIGDYENAIKFILLTIKVEETQDNPLSLTYA